MRFRFEHFQAGENKELTFQFLREQDGKLKRATISFVSLWEHPDFDPEAYQMFVNDTNLAQAKVMLRGMSFLEPDGARGSGQRQDVKQALDSLKDTLFVSLPHSIARDIFYEAMEMWGQYTICPLEMKMVEHPGYPLVLLIFDGKIITCEAMSAMAQEVLRGIAHIEFEDVVAKEEEASGEEEEDEANPDHVIEDNPDDMDPELRELLAKNQSRTEYEELPIKTGDIVDAEEEEIVVSTEEEEIAVSTEEAAVGRKLDYRIMFSTVPDWAAMITIYARAMNDRKAGKILKNIPRDWFTDHQSDLGRWCFPTSAAAFRTSLGDYAKHYTDEEILEKHPNHENLVHVVQVEGCTCIMEDEEYGMLMVQVRED